MRCAVRGLSALWGLQDDETQVDQPETELACTEQCQRRLLGKARLYEDVIDTVVVVWVNVGDYIEEARDAASSLGS